MSRRKQTPKTRKQHNPRKRLSRLSANTRVWTWQGQAQIESDRHVRVTTKIGGSWLDLPGVTERRAVTNQQANWIFGWRALCVDNQGNTYVESATAALKACRLIDLQTDDLNFRLIEEMLDGVKSSHIYDAGWFAQSFVGDCWEDDDQCMGELALKGLGWLPAASPWRKRCWDDIQQELETAVRQVRTEHLAGEQLKAVVGG